MDTPTRTAGELTPEYAAWLDRVTATFDAVSYTCRIRMRDPEAARAVALRVATGLVSRPAVFRHWGLPYSGRIAKLAEDGIADAAAGRLVPRGSWADFRAALLDVTPEDQDTVVLACVEGLDADALAAHWACGVDEAAARRAGTIAHLKELAVRHGDGGPDPRGRTDIDDEGR